MKILKKGDRFTEMYCFWLYILKTTKKSVWIASASVPCEFPDDAEIEEISKDDFKKRFTWIWLVDRSNDVKGWLESKRKAYRT
jgi:hypothetical protein